MTQESLFGIREGGRIVPTVQERLLARREDPETSKAAAAKVASVLPE